MEKQKDNKGFMPASNKNETQVRIKFRLGREAEGVAMDADRCAVVDADLAAYLISINFADKAEE